MPNLDLAAERRKFVADPARAALHANNDRLADLEARSSGKTLPPSKWTKDFASNKFEELKQDKELIVASDELLEKLNPL